MAENDNDRRMHCAIQNKARAERRLAKIQSQLDELKKDKKQWSEYRKACLQEIDRLAIDKGE